MTNPPSVSPLRDSIERSHRSHVQNSRKVALLDRVALAARAIFADRRREPECEATLAFTKVDRVTKSRERYDLERALAWAERHSRERRAGYAVVVLDIAPRARMAVNRL